MAAYYLTDQLCACGCENRMPSTVVDRGWKYLRGHKPAGLKAAAKPISDRPVVLKAKAYSHADAIALADAELPMLEEQSREITLQCEEAQHALDAVLERIQWLKQLRAAAERLQGGQANHG